jgi:hypothetical protein
VGGVSLADYHRWMASENRSRKADGHAPLRDDSPVALEKRLAECTQVSKWRCETIGKRWRWALDGYLEGFLSDPLFDVEKDTFVKEAQSLITTDDLIAGLVAATEAAKRPLTETERKRRDQWLQSEEQRRQRLETQRQRRLLREGQRTLTAIRSALRHGVAPSPPPESKPVRTLPTS